ncbi:MAG: biopolymer transporter ExbD [Sphaerochaeta sp.]
MRNRRNLGQPSDIAFLLIIFFLLLSGIASSSGIVLSLSETMPKDSIDKRPLSLTLSRNGAIYSRDTIIEYHDLTTQIATTNHVIITVEKGVPWQQVVSLLSIIEQQGTATFSLELSYET